MRTRCVLLILACAISRAAPVQESSGEEAAVTIRALEHAWFAAQSHNDNRALNQIFDNALVYIEYGRILSKSEYLAKVRTEDSHRQQVVMEPMTIRVFGTTAIAAGTYRERSIKNGKPLVRRWRFVDTWIYKQGAWKLVAAGSAPIMR